MPVLPAHSRISSSCQWCSHCGPRVDDPRVIMLVRVWQRWDGEKETESEKLLKLKNLTRMCHRSHYYHVVSLLIFVPFKLNFKPTLRLRSGIEITPLSYYMHRHGHPIYRANTELLFRPVVADIRPGGKKGRRHMP